MRALVFGADGFAGRWLVRHLVESGDRVWAAGGPRFVPPLEDAVESVALDVRDSSTVATFVQHAAPDALYFLAGVSGREGRDDPDLAIGISVTGALNVLVGCIGLASRPRLLFVSTGYVYGPSPELSSEASAVRPDVLYAAAKLAGERALASLAPALGVDLLIARPFNHIGPGQRPSFLVPTIARQIVSGSSTVRLRSATAVRDFTDVRDVVGAYRVIVDRGQPGLVYNVASGTGTSTAEVGQAMLRLAGMESRLEAAETDASVEDRMVGDAARLRALGWRPRLSLDETLGDVLEEWRLRPPIQ